MKIQVLESFLFFLLLPHWARQLFLEIPPFISDPGNLFLILLFCDSLALYIYNVCSYFAFALLQSKIRLIDYCVQVLRSEEGNAGKATSHSPSCSLKYG